jgi:hypothetical protein
MTYLTDTIEEVSAQCTVNAGGSKADCIRVKDELGHGLPQELEDFYSKWHSITGEYGLSVIWPVDRVIEGNLRFRNEEAFHTLYMPFDCCLFFSDAGNGDQFFVPVYRDGSTSWQVYVWNHETDERKWVAGHIHQFIKGWVNGEISI